jgi:alpha-ketoglutarate-dependent taurine dioxygenase
MSSHVAGIGPRRRSGRRSPVGPADLVRRSFLDEEPFGLLIETTVPGVDLVSWLAGRREEMIRDLDRYAAVMFRGFEVDSASGFGDAARAISPELLGYLERAAPRSEVADKVFTSTEFSSDQWIPMHHEMSYSHNWPSLLYFYCEIPATEGGATPLASERRVYPRIPVGIRERFKRHGVRYVRNYSQELDLPWQEVFQTSDRAEVEEYCRDSVTDFTWIGSDGLRTSAVRQAVAIHPRTHEPVWFNHAHLFHVSNMPQEVSETLLAELGMEGLPRNAYYGDGELIETEVVDLIRDLYRDSACSFPWQQGDVLVVDNFLATHGRAPFQGERRVLVAMSDLYVNRGKLG